MAVFHSDMSYIRLMLVSVADRLHHSEASITRGDREVYLGQIAWFNMRGLVQAGPWVELAGFLLRSPAG